MSNSKKSKLPWALIKTKIEPSLLKTIKVTLKKHSKEDLRKLLSTQEGIGEIASNVFKFLPKGSRSMVDEEAHKELFVQEVQNKINSALNNRRLFKKIFGYEKATL